MCSPQRCSRLRASQAPGAPAHVVLILVCHNQVVEVAHIAQQGALQPVAGGGAGELASAASDTGAAARAAKCGHAGKAGDTSQWGGPPTPVAIS